MSTDIVKFAFIAGEISPTLFGRSDLTRYDFGMAEARNFFVDYRGGLSSRPGTEFKEFVMLDTQNHVWTEFQFSPDTEDTYIILFGHQYIRFLQSGSYVLETAKNITAHSAGTFTSAAHGFSNGDWVKLSGVGGLTNVNGRTFQITGVTTNTFQLLEVPALTAFTPTGTYTSGGTASRIYTVVSPYQSADLEGLSFDQYRDTINITSSLYAPRNLVRTDHTNWTLSEAVISEYKAGPSIASTSASAAGSAQVVFAVTAVYANGEESSLGAPTRLSSIVNYIATEGSVKITINRDSEAVRYNVYRSIVSSSETVSLGAELGYVGKMNGLVFTDPNITPDFTKQAPVNFNPFAPGAITSIQVTNGGSGYTESTTATMSGGGTGFVGRVIVDNGAISSVLILSAGEDYVNPTISFSIGTGAAATVEANPTTGTFPALSAIFQQRQIYAASDANPITIWGSQIKRFDNFNQSPLVLDTDSFDFDLDTAAIAPIRHLVSTRGGLLAMTQDNVWMVNGGSAGQALTPSNALADPQTYTGVSEVKPIRIGSDILYTEGRGFAVRMLTYNEIAKVYAGDDRSLLSNHLFGEDQQITKWAYQASPFKTVWAVREDGALLAFTIVQSEEVYAWTPCFTKGKYLDVISIQEGTTDRVYVMTQRLVNGRWTKFIELMDLRQFINPEDIWGVDCGLTLDPSNPNATIYLTRSGEIYTIIADASVFTGTVGQVIRFASGIFEIASVTSGTEVVVTVLAEPTNWIPETDRAQTFQISTGNWSLAAKVTAISGLWHLEGQTVSILGDGNVFPQQTVTAGGVTLSDAVSKVTIGLPFTCRAKTLPLIVPDAGIEAKRKRIVGIAVRLTSSRGLKSGDAYDRLYQMRERRNEAWGTPTNLQNGISYQAIGTRWDEEGQTYFELTDPLAVTLLSLVQDVEIGDEPD